MTWLTMGPLLWLGVLLVIGGWMLWREHRRDVRDEGRRDVQVRAQERSVIVQLRPRTGDVSNVVPLHRTPAPVVPIVPADGGPHGEFLPDPTRGAA